MSSAELHIVVLAAGKGSRMRSSVPKVLHEVAGKPLLGHVLDSVRELKPDAVHVVVGHGRQTIIDAFRDDAIQWVEQADQLGTGHAVMQALPGIDKNAYVIMLTADVPLISATSLQPLVDSMGSHSLAVLTANVDDPHGLGRILRDDSGNLCGIVEEKDASAEQRAIQEINSGIMCARAEELNKWLADVSADNAQQEYYLTDIVQLAHADGAPIFASQPEQVQQVEGINTRAQLAQVERLYQLKKAKQLMDSGVTIVDPARIDIRGEVEIGEDTVIDVNCVIHGPTRIGSNVRISANCVISRSSIDDDSCIHPLCVIEDAVIGRAVNVGPFARLRPGTDLGDGVRIGNFVETKNARLAAGAKANHLSYVGDSTVGKNTNIGAGVITCNYDGANKHQTTIGDDVFVGSDSQLVAPVEIADGATIGAGSTITMDVKKDQLAVSRARQRQIDGWQRPRKPDQEKK